MVKVTRGGSKSRKYGRKKLRSQAQARYTSSRRWETNKRRKVQKVANNTGRAVKIKEGETWVTITPNKPHKKAVTTKTE